MSNALQEVIASPNLEMHVFLFQSSGPLAIPLHSNLPLQQSLTPPFKVPATYLHSTSQHVSRRAPNRLGPPRNHRRIPPRKSLQVTASANGKDGEAETEPLGINSTPASPTELVSWGGNLPSRRRVVVGGLGALTVALGSNFAGLTSSLLGLAPGVARSARADLLFPVDGFKRCLESGRGFEFVYPASWLGDQRLLYRAVERAEQERSLDLPPISAQKARRSATEPVVAFGPAGGLGDLNVSVVVAPIAPNFRLEQLGGPGDAGQRILSSIIAPEGSDKKAVLLAATEKGGAGTTLYYTLEYTVKGPTFFRHNVAVYASQRGLLYSLNAMCPEDEWPTYKKALRFTADSFGLTSGAPGGAAEEYVNRL